MTLAQSLTAIIIFWAIIGGLGASLLLPAMQSLIHGNFEGAAQKKAYALVGAAAAIAAAVGPLLGGFVTTFLSWRVGFALEVVIIAVVLSQIRLVQRRAVHRGRGRSTSSARCSRWSAWAASCSASSSGRRAARYVVPAHGRRRRRAGARSPGGSCAASARARSTLIDPDLFRFPHFTRRDLRADAAERHPRRRDDRAAALPADDARVQRDAGRAVAGAAVADACSASRCWPGKKAGNRRPSNIVRVGFALTAVGMALIIPIVPAHRLRLGLVVPLLIAGSGLGPARLAAEQLHARRRSTRSASAKPPGSTPRRARSGSRSASRWPAASCSRPSRFEFTNLTEDSTVIPPAQQQQIADTLEDDAEVMSNTQLEPLLAGEPPDVQAEILRINKRSPQPLPPGRAARARARQPPRGAQRLPDAATPRPDSRRKPAEGLALG